MNSQITKTLLKRYRYRLLNGYNFSTINKINERDNYFRSLLKKEKLNANELGNIARVLTKQPNLEEFEIKKFDDQTVALAKQLDYLQLRQVINYYAMTNRENKFVFYELNQRYKQVGLQDYTHIINRNTIHTKVILFLFGLRNNLFNIASKITRINLK